VVTWDGDAFARFLLLRHLDDVTIELGPLHSHRVGAALSGIEQEQHRKAQMTGSVSVKGCKRVIGPRLLFFLAFVDTRDTDCRIRASRGVSQH